MVEFEVGTSSLVRTWANSGTKVNTDTVLVGGVPKTNIGWQPQEKPPSQYFNGQMNQLGQKINHCLQNGVPLWNSTTAYTAGNAVGYTNGVWLCVTGNTNSAPTLLNSNWLKVSTATEIATVNTTIVSLFGNPTGGNPTRTSNTTITLPAGLMAKTTDGLDVIKLTSNVVLDISTTGLNKLDTGTVTNDTWYYVWLLKNPTTGIMGGLLSLSSISPTLPSGFSRRAFLGFAIRYRDSKIFPFVVDMNQRRFTHLTDVSGGSDFQVFNAGLTTAYQDIDITAWVFPLAKSIDLTTRNTNGIANNFTVRAKGMTGDNPPSNGVMSEHNRYVLPLLSDVVIQAKSSNASATNSIDIHGYGF